MNNKPIATKEEYQKVCEAAYRNALDRCYQGGELAAYMFMQGALFERKREIPKTFIDKLDELKKQNEIKQ